MKTYIFIDSFNGSGYSDSNAYLIKTDNPIALAQYLGEIAMGGSNDTFEPIEDKDAVVSFSYHMGDEVDYGRVTLVELREQVFGVMISPNCNEYEVVTTKDRWEWFKNLVREESHDYYGDEMFNTVHHEIWDDGADIILVDNLTEYPFNYEDAYEFDYDGDGVEYEVWKNKFTKQTVRVPIEIVRNFSNTEPIGQE